MWTYLPDRERFARKLEEKRLPQKSVGALQSDNLELSLRDDPDKLSGNPHGAAYLDHDQLS